MFYVFHLMAVNCSNRIKKKIENQSFCLVHLHFTFLYNVFLLPIVFTIPFFGFTFSLGFFFICWLKSVFLPTMAFVFYHKFMWLKSRLRQAEKDRQLAQQDNRLFKQEFGDKINSLQLEVEELSRQR